MASFFLLGLVFSAFLASASSVPEMATREDVNHAVQKMQESGYYTFVTLINLMQDRIIPNITLLMPSDKHLASMELSEWDIPSFLDTHSIPSNLQSEHLARLPAGTLLPTGRPSYGLLVTSNGSRLSLNGIRIVKPDICRGGPISCHGISNVLRSDDGAATCVTTPPGTFTEWPSPGASPYGPEGNRSAALPPTDAGSESSGVVGVKSREQMLSVLVSLSMLLCLNRLQ